MLRMYEFEIPIDKLINYSCLLVYLLLMSHYIDLSSYELGKD